MFSETTSSDHIAIRFRGWGAEPPKNFLYRYIKITRFDRKTRWRAIAVDRILHRAAGAGGDFHRLHADFSSGIFSARIYFTVRLIFTQPAGGSAPDNPKHPPRIRRIRAAKIFTAPVDFHPAGAGGSAPDDPKYPPNPPDPGSRIPRIRRGESSPAHRSTLPIRNYFRKKSTVNLTDQKIFPVMRSEIIIRQ